jgi:type III restriction enzyme
VLFCQREAAETAIFLAEVAGRHGTADYRGRLDPLNKEHNANLPRVALKMATGSGKTVVMAMLIAWHTLNKVHTPQDARFSKRFLVVTPGITIRDRLRVLLPSDPDNYFRERDLVPPDLWGGLHEAQVVITNYHQFIPKDRKEIQGVASNTRKILLYGKKVDPFKETGDEMASRVLRDFIGRGRNEIVVFNDEAHHCYQDKVLGTDDADKPDKEAEERNADARVWFKGLQAVRKKIGLKTIYDMSATPFYLAGSGHQEGYIFPWVVCDFSLMDAIESGIVKVPRLPVDDNARTEVLVYRNLWSQIGADLPKRASARKVTNWVIPPTLEGAMRSLYGSYEKAYKYWDTELRKGGYETPPVFIVVCPNTTVSKLVYEWIAGQDIEQPDGSIKAREGSLPLLTNVDDSGRWIARPRTILIDSRQLESGEAMKTDFKDAVGHEIEQFKRELRERNQSAVDVDNLTDEDLLREVMNTVGKPGRLGEGVRCVVSVSMLTEGWDANTVTHILGIRAFNSRLLCEQVVGRALRRRSYAVNDEGLFDAEYAEVYGVPFDFIPSDRVLPNPKPKPHMVQVRALPEREHLRITFPRLDGYRVEMGDEALMADFTKESHLHVDRSMVATWTQMAGQAGENAEHVLDGFMTERPQRVAYEIAAYMVQRFYAGHDGALKPWLFPQLVQTVRQWLDGYVTPSPHPELGLLLLAQVKARAAEKVFNAIVRQEGNRPEVLRPRFATFEPEGSTDRVDFLTRKVVIPATKSHVNQVVLDGVKGNTWEERLAEFLEADPRVAAFVKNDHLDFKIPYLFDGVPYDFLPDFLVRLVRADDREPERTLIVEVSGGRKDQAKREVKALTARDQWCVAVNNHKGFGIWGFVEIDNMNHAAYELSAAIDDVYANGVATGGVDLL